jgi:hypothetical protein
MRIKKVSSLIFRRLAVLTLAFLLPGQLTATAQKSGKRPKAAYGRKAPVMQQFDVEAPIKLRLRGCRGDINFPALTFIGNGLEVDGDVVTLESDSRSSISGNVVAYARSAYRIDSNVAFTFIQTRVAVTSPNWSPPVILSLRLLQNGKNRNRVMLVPVPSAGPNFPSTILTCVEAGARPRT